MTETEFEEDVFTAVVAIESIEILIELIVVIVVTSKLIRRCQLALLPFYVKIIVGVYIFFVLYMTSMAITFVLVLQNFAAI